jgi:hypothetical protein
MIGMTHFLWEMPLKKNIALGGLVIACFMPIFWRVAARGASEPIGLLSDLALGLLVLALCLLGPWWARIPLVLLWGAAQLCGHELLAAMQRMPVWQDLHYLVDRDFMARTTAGLNFSSPVTTALLALSMVLACLPRVRFPKKWLASLGVLAVLLLVAQGFCAARYDRQSVQARYNPLHWLALDGLSPILRPASQLADIELPPGLNTLDLDAPPLISLPGKAKNVLIVVLEGIPGLYHPEIRAAMAKDLPADITMHRLDAAAKQAMLVPDLTAHSHQTIRGLYAILCGDYSKLSWDTPKGFELASNPVRAADCLPAVMGRAGWSTHFLQAAGLGFMGKDRVMPRMGFQQVHGSEWFTDPNPYPFEWGAVDSAFFAGARRYIAELQRADSPWMLTLLTVGTHQPYGVPDGIEKDYPSRKHAVVDLLDQAVADFITKLRQDGVLENTLVVLLSDESHGSAGGDWICSWGLGMVLAPETLPRLKKGGYGLVDVEASVLDYCGITPPRSIIGRSLFRDYAAPREMIAFTASRLRVHTADNKRYECTADDRCLVGVADSLLGPPPEGFESAEQDAGPRLRAMAKVLDSKLHLGSSRTRVLKFANGEQRLLPEKITNEWSDNLAGAQYLDFPAQSTVEVSIRYTMLSAPPEGVRLKLLAKEWEATQTIPEIPEFPVAAAGEEQSVRFSFANPRDRQAFSFHLLGEGKDVEIRLDQFDVAIVKSKG